MAATATAAALMEPTLDVDKLSYEIFSILESGFLFGYDATPPSTPPAAPPPPKRSGKVRILSLDAGGGLLAAASLARLESTLRRRSGDPSAHISDFFDVAAGSGGGGILAAMLFTRSPASGDHLFSAESALRFLSNNPKLLAERRRSKKRFGFFRRSDDKIKRIFADATLRDTVKPLLVPCHDLATGAQLLFSRADAVEADAYDFLLRDVCAATCAAAEAAEVRSVDGRTRVAAVGGAVAARNPTAAAIAHVLNNKQEFPLARGVEDLLVVSVGGGGSARGSHRRSPLSAAELVGIGGEQSADMVDQAVAMAFGRCRGANYVRIQVDGLDAAAMMGERSVESVLFSGRKMSEGTNGERLDWVAGELIKEEERRVRIAGGGGMPTVVIKPAITPPRSSSATTATTSTGTSAMTATTTTLSSG